ncbi:MAG TPA: hypothetical protein VHQ87_10305 [Rhizobacter sp.]|jgi:hypothetical protein|nr:hypothetical protein [Rhizobacter sp.]
MGFTQEQKAAVGNAYIAEIKRRIAVRKASKDKLAERVLAEPDVTTAALRLVKRMFKEVEVVTVVNDDAHIYRHGPNAHIVDVKFVHEGKERSLGIDRGLFPVLNEHKAAKDKADKLKSDLCEELEFLSMRAMNPGTVSAFQQHAQRLMAVKPGESISGCLDMIDDFLTSRRGFTCTL